MDLLSSIRKSGSRGGVNFSWDEVQTSQHRENYLGHSLMAPVGRWQKGKDLNWYAKGDSAPNDNETVEEKHARERKEEIRRIKEAEEDALARALGLPVAQRNTTGANNVEVGELKRVIKETEEGDDDIDKMGKGTGFGDFVGKTEGETLTMGSEEQKGGLLRKGRDFDRDDRGGERRVKREGGREGEKDRRRHRSRSRDRERRQRNPRNRSISRDRERHRSRRDVSPRRRERKRSRSRSPVPNARQRKYRSRSPVRRHRDQDRDDDDRRTYSGRDRRPRRSSSPENEDRRRYAEFDRRLRRRHSLDDQDRGGRDLKS